MTLIFFYGMTEEHLQNPKDRAIPYLLKVETVCYMCHFSQQNELQSQS